MSYDLDTRLETEKRRILQPLWNAMHKVVFPHLRYGVALCVSGGADSRALMETMALWPVGCQSQVVVLSIDHQTRPESSAEAYAVVSRAKVLGFAAEMLTLYPVTKTDEATLRKQRYEVLWRYAEANNLNAICTAHHQDDDAEGFFMDLFGLGGGREGSAMDSELETKSGLVLRPFLTFSKKNIVAVLTVLNKVDYFTDPTNENNIAKRSQVRSWLNAELVRFHPAPHQRMAKIAQRRGLDLQALCQVSEKLIEIKSPECVRVSLLPQTPDSILCRALGQALKVLLPNKDLRQASETLQKLAIKAKKSATDHAQGLDQTACSITVDNKILFRLDLPGVRATVTLAGIELQKIVDKSTFTAEEAVF